MKKKRIVFLLGAGAASSWGGPSTKELFDLIERNSKFKTASGENVISYFFNLLNKSYDNPVNINFETIISLLEVLFEYYENTTISGNTPVLNPIWPSIFNIYNEIDNELFSHYVIETHAKSDQFTEEDTVDVFDNSNNMVNNLPCARSRWKVMVLLNIYSSIIETISDRVLEYDTEAFRSKTQPSNWLMNFVSYFTNINSILRFYTTNYDKLLFTILKSKGIVFDGFNISIGDSGDKIFDTNKVMSDFDILCYYNLHGSIYWSEYFSHKSLNTEFESSNIPSYNPFGASRFIVDNAKEVLFSNILVGNNKTQKVNIPPLNYFESSFNQDCIKADILFVIGSSLNDYNIRNSLFTALVDSNKVLIIVTKIDSIKIEEIRLTIQNVSPIPERKYINKYKNSNEWWVNREHNCYVYTNGFDKFLNTKAWEEII